MRQNLRFSEMKTSQKSVYGTGIANDGHTLNRGTVVDNERLQNFSVDTQLESKFATGEVEHTLLTGVDFMRMRNDINARLWICTINRFFITNIILNTLHLVTQSHTK
ncbi:hypothetical protein ACVXHA_29900 [Escherichia coli]